MPGLTRFCTVALILLLAGLLGTGCGSTKTVGPDGSPHRAEINEEAKGNTAMVALRDGEEMKLNKFRIQGDSVSGFTSYGSPVSIPTSRINRVGFKDRLKSTLYYGVSLGILGFASGYLMAVNGGAADKGGSVPTDTQLGIEIGGGVGAVSGLFGAGVGALVGYNESYKFKTPPSLQEPRTPTEEEERVIAREKPNSPSESSSPDMMEGEAEKASTASIVDTDIPETDVKRPDDIAVVIGNTEYENSDIPNVDYAVRDAEIMKKYLTRTLGFREENVIYVENATGSAMSRIFGTDDDPQGQLYNWVKAGESSVFVYYSGHGAPNPESGSPYFIPTDTNPSYLSQNGYPVNQFYENLAQLPAESVTVVLEACFSGVSESGSVVSDISPAVLSVENPVMGMENGIAFTAGAADQVSTWYNEKRHGLFTYYFLKGLRGEADVNSDEAITAEEMKQYVNEEVPYRARRLHNREQNPQVVGQNLERVLVRYGDSTPATQQKARLPVTTTDMEASVKNALSLPDGAKKVTSVDDTDALRQDDVITAADGSDLESAGRLAEIVEQHAPGDTLRLKILREGDSQTVSVTLTASQ